MSFIGKDEARRRRRARVTEWAESLPSGQFVDVQQMLGEIDEIDALRARVAELEAAGSVSPRPPLRGGTPWQILAPEGPSARRDGYAVVTADWSEDADRAEYYVAEQMTREVAEMLVRAGSVSPNDAHTSTARHTEWLTFGTEDGDEGVETFETEADAQRAADRWLRRGMTDVYVERHDVHVERRTVSTTTRTTAWKAETP